MLRRNLLLASPALVLPGCATFDSNVGKAAELAAEIAGGLAGAVAQLAPLNISVPSEVATALALLQTVAADIKTASSTAAQQPLVQKIESYVNTIVGALAVIPLIPPPISTILQAAMIVLPILESVVGMMFNANRVSSARRLQVPAPNMTPDQAHIVLKAAAARPK